MSDNSEQRKTIILVDKTENMASEFWCLNFLTHTFNFFLVNFQMERFPFASDNFFPQFQERSTNKRTKCGEAF